MAKLWSNCVAALVVITIAGFACSKKKSTVDDTKVTISSTEDATKDLVDEDYRFRIRWPGVGWKLISEQDMRQISPDAIAGVVSDKHVWGAIIVERFSGGDISAFAKLIIDNIPLEGKVIEAEEKVEFAGKQAQRFTLRGRISGMDARYVGIIFGHDNHIYQVMSWSQQGILSDSGVEAQKFFDAFTLLDGPVKGREQVIVTHDTQGPGWRVRDGVFLSAVHQLRIKPPAGWRVAVGTELRNMNADAEVALVASNPELYITVLAESSSARAEEEKALQRLTRDNVEQAFEKTRRGESMELEIAGVKRTFDRTIVEEPPFEFLTTSFLHQGEWVQIQAWYVSTLADADKARIRDGLSALEFLAQAEADKARAELAQAPDTQNAVGASYSLRRGLYRDFEHKWTWRAPKAGFWRIEVGQEARSMQADARMSAEEAGTSIYLRASSGSSGQTSLKGYADQVQGALTMMGVTVTGRKSIKLGDRDGMVLVGDASLRNGAKAQYRALAALGPDNIGLRVDSWGIVEQMKKHTDMVDEALSGFRFEPSLETIGRDGDVFRDFRMGYTLELGSRWSWEEKTPSSMVGLGSAMQWKSGRSEVFVLSLCALDANHDEEWFFDFMEQRVRENLGALIAGDPKKSTVTVAGESARELVWKTGSAQIYAYLVRRDYTLYMIMGSNLSDGDAEWMRTKFAFLD